MTTRAEELAEYRGRFGSGDDALADLFAVHHARRESAIADRASYATAIAAARDLVAVMQAELANSSAVVADLENQKAELVANVAILEARVAELEAAATAAPA